MSEKRRQDLVYPPGPETQRGQDKLGHRPEVEVPTITGRLFRQFWFVRHDEEAILKVLRQVPCADRLHARIALFQALGGQYASAGPRALLLCERVFGSGTMYFPSELTISEKKDQLSPEALPPSRSAASDRDPEPALEPEAAFDHGRIHTLCEHLKRLVLQQPSPPAPEILALLDAAESHVTQAALSRLNSTLLPGEDRYGKTYYQALKQTAGETVSAHLTGRREILERRLPRWHKAGQLKNPPPLPLETRLLRQGAQHGGGQLLGSWDKSVTPEAKVRRHAEAEERLAEDHPVLATLGQGGGEPLPEAVLGRMNRLLGHDFSHVRIHMDARAAEVTQLLGARALASGTHVYFGAGQFAPGTPAGDHLLLHELFHVVQFDEGRLPAAHGARLEMSRPEDPAEQEAEARAQSLDDLNGSEAMPAAHGARLEMSRPEDSAEQEAEARAQSLDDLNGSEAMARSGGAAAALVGLLVGPRAPDRKLLEGILGRLSAPTARAGLAWLRSIPSAQAGQTLYDVLDQVTGGGTRRVATSLGDLPAALERTFGPPARSVEITRDHPVPHGAEAVTAGGRVFLGPHQFDLKSEKGRVRLGHEVAHALQQRRGEDKAAGVTARERAGLEAEAEMAGRAFAAQRPFTVTGQAPIAALLYRGGPPVEDDLDGTPPGGQVASGEVLQILVRELQSAGPGEAKRRLARAVGQGRALLITAIRRVFPEQAEAILREDGQNASDRSNQTGAPTARRPGKAPDPNRQGPDGAMREPSAAGATTENAGTPGAPKGSTSRGGAAGARGRGPKQDPSTATHRPGPARRPQPNSPGAGSEAVAGTTAPAVGGDTPDPAGQLAGLSTSDLALISAELVEHQRWASALGNVGQAGSTERAAFIAEEAGQGAILGAATGFGVGFALGAVGKLAQQFTRFPGVGAILGGAMAAYSLAHRNWHATGATIAKFGQGADIYETLANSIASISEIIDVATHILNVLAGIIGVISGVMWLISIVTLGVASPLAATLSAIAIAIGTATMALDGINNLVLQPCVLLFRALHTFSSQADPRDIELEGEGLRDASQRVAGMLGGLAGAKAGERPGGAVANRIQTRLRNRSQEAGSRNPLATENQAPTQDAPPAAQEGPQPPPEAPPRAQEARAPQETQAPQEGQAHAPQEVQAAPQETQVPKETQTQTQTETPATTEPQQQPTGTRVTDSPRSKTGETYETKRWTEMKDGQPRTYREIEVHGPNGEIKTYQERLTVKNRWKKRGRDGNAMGREGEAASRRMTAADVANAPPGTKAVQVNAQNKQGHGFDDVLIRIDEQGRAKIRIFEVKNYTNQQVPSAKLTAIRENIRANLEMLAARVRTDYEAMGLTMQERNAVLDAIQNHQFEISFRLGPTTQLANKQRGSVLRNLETTLQRDLGPDVQVSDPERIPPEFFNPSTTQTSAQGGAQPVASIPEVAPVPASAPQTNAAPPTSTPATPTRNGSPPVSPAAPTSPGGPPAQGGAQQPNLPTAPTTPPLRPALAAVDSARDENGQRQRRNPNYPPPPGTLAQLQQIQGRILQILAARAHASDAETAMAHEQAQAEGQRAPIQQTVAAGRAATEAAQAHQQLVTAHTTANQEQQARQQQASGLIAGYPARAAGLSVLKVPLAAFRGFTWIASKLPGRAGAAMQRMNDDANRLDRAFGQMDGTMGQQAQTQPAQQQRLQADAGRISKVGAQAQTSQGQFETSVQSGQTLQRNNEASAQQAGAARSEAQTQGAALDQAAQQGRAEQQSLAQRLRSWAAGHRQARQVTEEQESEPAGGRRRKG